MVRKYSQKFTKSLTKTHKLHNDSRSRIPSMIETVKNRKQFANNRSGSKTSLNLNHSNNYSSVQTQRRALSKSQMLIEMSKNKQSKNPIA